MLTARDQTQLAGVHPQLITLIDQVFTRMSSLSHPMFVVMGVRTAAQQQALYAQGRTLPGKIVTMLDGVKKPSNHQPHADGYGHAVDCAFECVDPFGETQPWLLYGTTCEELAHAQGLTVVWGGRWHVPVDRPHIELTSA